MTRRVSAAPWIGVVGTVGLMAAAIVVPWALHADVHVRWFPPLHADWDPRVGPGTIPAVILAILAIAFATDVAARVRWRWLLLGSFLVAVAWLVSLATVDGLAGIGHILDTQFEYLRTARSVGDFGAILREYIARIPIDAPHHWPVHIAGHPPGALLFFVVLVHLGLGSGLAAGFAVIVVASTTPIAVLLTVRRLGGEGIARRAAPFLVLGPAAIWMAVSADAVFGAFAAWGLCALAFSATSTSRRAMLAWGAASGLLLGYCVMMSYGLPLLAIPAVAVLVVARSAKPLLPAVVAALGVVLAFAGAGFAWWQAYPALVERYWAGVASNRPFWYWVWGDLAAIAFSAGPILGASVAAAIRGARHALSRPIALLTLSALVAVLLADVSGMSKAEVERIWLPFVPWLLLGTALLPDRWRRGGLAVQVVFAVVVQHALSTGW